MIQQLDFQVPYIFRNRKSRSFRGVKINQIRDHLKIGPLKGRCLNKRIGDIKGPRHLQTKEKRETPRVLLFACTFSTPFCLLPNTKTHKKTHQNLLIILLKKNIRYYSYTQSSFPWSYILDLGFRDVDIAF